MSSERLHNQSVNHVAAATGSSQLLRSYGIDPTSRMSFETAAAAAGVNSDELLALIDIASRRARKAAPAPVPALAEEYEDESELVI